MPSGPSAWGEDSLANKTGPKHKSVAASSFLTKDVRMSIESWGSLKIGANVSYSSKKKKAFTLYFQALETASVGVFLFQIFQHGCRIVCLGCKGQEVRNKET